MVIDSWDMLLRMGSGVILGAAIGLERERSGHPAGLRTHLLVSLASATFMIVSTQFVYFQSYGKDDLVTVDTSRIAASVVTGMGFLGGGAILRTGINIQGLTTAASLWLVAAIGLAAGGGMHLVAVMATLAALFGLTILRWVEGMQWQLFHRQVEIMGQASSLDRQTVIAELTRLKASVTDVEYDHNIEANESKLTFTVSLPSGREAEQLFTRLESLPGVHRIRVQRLG
jgi:putative Mg2+ transporter-C (MgtC) family protein